MQDSPEGGFEARALSASIYTEADTLDELKELIRDAVSCHFDENERPKLYQAALRSRRDYRCLNVGRGSHTEKLQQRDRVTPYSLIYSSNHHAMHSRLTNQ